MCLYIMYINIYELYMQCFGPEVLFTKFLMIPVVYPVY